MNRFLLIRAAKFP